MKARERLMKAREKLMKARERLMKAGETDKARETDEGQGD